LKVGHIPKPHRRSHPDRVLTSRMESTFTSGPRVQNLADCDEICITEDVHDAAGVAEIVGPYSVAKSEAELKGRQQGHVGLSLRPCRQR
jgi:hypothetical protein